MNLQKLLFPSGIIIDPIKRQYRTSKVNQIFLLTSSISRNKGGKEKDSSTLNEDESCLVAGAGLEPSIFELSIIVYHTVFTTTVDRIDNV